MSGMHRKCFEDGMHIEFTYWYQEISEDSIPMFMKTVGTLIASMRPDRGGVVLVAPKPTTGIVQKPVSGLLFCASKL